MSRYAGTLGNEMDRYRIAGDNEANPFPAIKSFSFAYRNIIINYILLCMHIYMEAKRHWSLDQLSAWTGRKCQEIDTQTLFPFFFFFLFLSFITIQFDSLIKKNLMNSSAVHNCMWRFFEILASDLQPPNLSCNSEWIAGWIWTFSDQLPPLLNIIKHNFSNSIVK